MLRYKYNDGWKFHFIPFRFDRLAKSINFYVNSGKRPMQYFRHGLPPCVHEPPTALKPSWAKRPGLSCGCLPSCNETEIVVITDIVKSTKPQKKKSDVELNLAYLPTQRFRRNVVRSRLDLVVSVGGTTGLFVGASILSFVELIFYFTIRFISNVFWMKNKSNESKRFAERLENVERDAAKHRVVKNDRTGPYNNSGVGASVLFYNRLINKYNENPLQRKNMYNLKVYKR
ncbi:hypothetical protein ACJJTC_005632 [Scirpophaga incertulas]